MLKTDDKYPTNKQKRPKFLSLTVYVVTPCQCPNIVVAVIFTVVLNPLFAIRPETENHPFKVPIVND
jgi:hypothetical protein